MRLAATSWSAFSRRRAPRAVIEAMKMQNIIRAERDGTVKSVGPKAGDSVAADEVLVEFA